MGASAPIAVGVAGWSYPDWEGYVYQADTKDKLLAVASFVDMIEINSTFYRPPSAANSASWVRRTASFPDFFFTAKLHQDVTHRGIIMPDMIRAFHEGFAPMREAGKLRHLLAQFKYDFADAPLSREHLARIREAFADVANLTLELRHNSWQAPAAQDFLAGLGVTVANLDYPMARNSFNLQHCTVGRHAYLRLHGRNAKSWFAKGAGRDEVYNYLYSPGELKGIVSRALELARMTTTLTVVANNHYQGKEMVNALQLKALLTERKVPVPSRLSAQYPELRDVAAEPG